MPTPTAVLIELSDEERGRLEAWSRRRKTAQALALRSRIVLAAAGGAANHEIAEQLSISRPTVTKWRNRFAEQRLEGLLDEPRPGRPRTVSDAQVEQIVTTTLESTPKNATHWSTRSLAAHLGVSQDSVWRTWQAFSLQPHRQQKFKLSTEVPAHLAVHLVLDNSSTHKTPKIKRWLAQHPRFILHFTPTSSSWINLVERWFAELTTKKLKRSAHRTVRALNADIRAWIEDWNENPRPYVWTKPAERILQSIARYCERINQTAH